MLVALKSIGNAGAQNLLSSVNRLENCYNNRKIPIAIRLTAMDALRNVPCGEYEVVLILYN